MHNFTHRVLDLVYPGLWEIRLSACFALSNIGGAVTDPPQFALRGAVGTYVADPMVYEYDGRRALFYEHYIAKQAKGVLVAQELSQTFAPIGNAVTVLAEPWHLSFPFLFSCGTNLYLIPESFQRKAVPH